MPAALVLEAPDRLTLAERPIPVPGPGQVLVRVARVGLCGTDLHIVEGTHPRATFPLVLGHEIVGRLDESASGLVVVDPLLACGSCVACQRGQPHVCAEPLAVAVHAVRRAGVGQGEVVVIVGAGPIGLLLAFVAARAGARRLFVSEPAAARRAFAATYGLELLDPGDPVGDLARRTDGRLADVAFDAAAVPAVAGVLPHLVRPAGRIALVGVYGRPAEVDLQAVVFREQTILGNRVYTPPDIDRALALLADDGDRIRSLVSEVVPLTEAAAAFERFRTGQGVKVVVSFEAT